MGHMWNYVVNKKVLKNKLEFIIYILYTLMIALHTIGIILTGFMMQCNGRLFN